MVVYRKLLPVLLAAATADLVPSHSDHSTPHVRREQSAMNENLVRKLTPVLVVEEIEPCLPFWVERLDFKRTVEVPEGTKLGFVILEKDGTEVMYQSRASVEKDIPALAAGPRGHSTALYVEVSDVAVVERAMQGIEAVVPRRKTFYGMDEIGVREPGGRVVIFAQPVGEGSGGGERE
jgi:hypothetical protein